MDTSKLMAYMPLIQQLTRYAVFLLCLIIFGPQISAVLTAAEQRLAAGAEVSIGPAGIKLGEAPKMPVTRVASTGIGDFTGLSGIGMGGSGATGGGSGFGAIIQGAPVKGMGNVSRMATEDVYYLVHGSAKEKSDYSVKVSLGAFEPSLLDKVDRVIYHLHESFENSRREVTDRYSDFSLLFNAWGQFEIKADVYLKGQSTPIKLRRWLNF